MQARYPYYRACPRHLRREVKAKIEALPAEGFFEIARTICADEVSDTELYHIDVVCIRVKAGGKLLSADAARCQSDVDDEVAARDVLVAAQLVERAGEGAGASRVMQVPFFCVLVVWR